MTKKSKLGMTLIVIATLVLEAINIFWDNHPASMVYEITMNVLPMILVISALVILGKTMKELKQLDEKKQEIKELNEKLSNQGH